MKKDPENSHKKQSRRTFFKNAGYGTAAFTGIPLLTRACNAQNENSSSYENFFSKKDIIVFQGDSITDAGRDKKNEWANQANSFGKGYALILASKLLGEMFDKELLIYNRGISGNKVYQLAERWDKDCLELKPTILSILIGVNDYWHMRNGKYEGTPEIYEKDYRKLIQRTKDKFPEIKLIICEPFILTGTRAVDESWIEAFKPYQEIAAMIASEFNAGWVPFQKAFSDAAKITAATYWTEDGVHPSMAGSYLMAKTWLDSLG